MGFDKRQLYDTDTRVPYFVRGPGIVARGSTSDKPVSHVDLAPTIIDIALGKVPGNWDGHSFLDVLTGAAERPGSAASKDVLLQYFGEGKKEETCGANQLEYFQSGGAMRAEKVGEYVAAPCDGANNTYSCLRRVDLARGIDDVFCEFECFLDIGGGTPVPCPKDEAEGYGEYYDLVKDPWQQHNAARELDEKTKEELRGRLAQLKSCKGRGCQG